MKKILLALYLCSLGSIHNVHADQLPENWYAPNAGHELTENVSLPGMTSLYEVTSNAIDETDKQLKKINQWGVYGFITSLGVTASGNLGVVGAKGVAAAEVYWRKKQQNKSLENQSYDDADIYMTDAAEENGLELQVEEALNVLKVSTQFDDENQARQQLRGHLAKFREMAKAAMQIEDRDSAFYLGALRLDLSVNASGTITPIIGVGAGTQLRIFWTRIMPKNSSQKNIAANTTLTASGEKFIKAINSVMTELENLDAKNATKTGLQLSAIRLGVGINAAGSVAVVKVNGGFVMNVFLNKNPKAKSAIAGNNKFLRLPILAQVHNKNGELIDAALLPGQLNKGIKKAMKISEKFVAKAAAGKNKQFEPFMVWNIYSLSAGAGIGLVTLNGVAQLQLIYKK